MPQIFINIQLTLFDGLRAVLPAAEACSFCVGYLNLRGWGQLADFVERLPGDDESHACRLLIGMHRAPEEEMKALSGLRRGVDVLDGPSLARLKRRITESFKTQLEFGVPTNDAEAALRRLTRAHLRLHADAGATQDAMAAALPIGRAAVVRICRRLVEEGLEAALRDRQRPGAARKLEATQEALLIALACSTPPEGRACWTMARLADKLVELRVVETSSDETVRRTRKKTRRSPGRGSSGVCRRSMPTSSGGWRLAWTCMPSPTIPCIPFSVAMSRLTHASARSGSPCPRRRACRHGMTMSTGGRGRVIC